jgi:hypothetical protein
MVVYFSMYLARANLECRDAGVLLSTSIYQAMASVDGEHSIPISDSTVDLFDEFLMSQIVYRKALNTIELGSGCGIVGIAFAERLPNCKVLMTDLPEAKEIIHRNIALSRPAKGSTLQFLCLNWEKELPVPVMSEVFDVILVADCTYNSCSIPALVCTLSALVSHSPNAHVIVAHKPRHESESVFFEHMLSAGFCQLVCVDRVLPGESLDFKNQLPAAVTVYVFHRPVSCD